MGSRSTFTRKTHSSSARAADTTNDFADLHHAKKLKVNEIETYTEAEVKMESPFECGYRVKFGTELGPTDVAIKANAQELSLSKLGGLIDIADDDDFQAQAKQVQYLTGITSQVSSLINDKVVDGALATAWETDTTSAPSRKAILRDAIIRNPHTYDSNQDYSAYSGFDYVVRVMILPNMIKADDDAVANTNVEDDDATEVTYGGVRVRDSGNEMFGHIEVPYKATKVLGARLDCYDQVAPHAAITSLTFRLFGKRPTSARDTIAFSLSSSTDEVALDYSFPGGWSTTDGSTYILFYLAVTSVDNVVTGGWIDFGVSY